MGQSAVADRRRQFHNIVTFKKGKNSKTILILYYDIIQTIKLF